MTKKSIFERGAQEIFQNGGQIRVQHKKICQDSEVPELFGNFGPTLYFLPLSSLTKADMFKVVQNAPIIQKSGE